jgi:hypothetical protein
MQGILVFADATARDAAITSPEEGQFAFLKDTNVTTYYTGSAWANVDTTGMTNPMTTTGDVIYSSSGSTPARLGIGTAGQVLQVNSGATAPEWATPASGWPTAVGCSVYNAGGSVTYVANVPLIQNFTSENFDTNTMHDNSTNTSRITIPTGYAGKYLVNGAARFAVGVNYILMRVYQNGSAVTNGLESGELVRGYYAANTPGINGSVVLNLAVNDYIELAIQSDIAGSLATYCRFSVSYLGA